MKIYGTTVTTPLKLEKIAASGMIYYKENTDIDPIGGVGLQYPTAHDWTQEFSAVPRVGDIVISASKQLFKVSFVSDRKLNMEYIMDLRSEAAPSDERQLTGWTITENGDTVTLDYTLEDEAHTDVITFDANGYPTSINHDGFEATGTWG